MRRPLIVPTKGAEWRVSPFLIYDTNGNVVQPQDACGPYEERRDVQCVVNERPVGDSYCRDVGPKPEDSKDSFLDAGCSYDWYQGQWQDPGPSCSNAEAQQRTVECRRSYDDVKVSDSLCSGTKPATERAVVDHSTCTYSWNSSDPFADPGQNCTATEEWTRDVFCERDLDKVQVADGQCDAGSKPTTIDVREDYSSCSYSWDADEDFLDPGASCTDAETQTRAVWCKRDLDGNVEADAQCDPSTRPAASQSVEDFSGCDYSWAPQEWGEWDSQCSHNTTRSRSVDCLRSDGTVTNDMEARCLEDDGAKPATTETGEVYDSCTYDWVHGAWRDPGNSCTSAEIQERPVKCRRSDGRNVSEGLCNPSTKPSETQSVADYSACSYSWVEGGYEDPGASCTATETQNQTVTCRRSDGTTVSDSECNPATKPSTTQTVEDYSACSYDWIQSGFGPWSGTCTTNATRSQTVTCRRSDGTTVSDGNCDPSTRPTTSESAAVYSGCSYEWISGAWNDPGASCTASERQTRDVTCRRSDGTTVSDGSCDAGSKPSTTRNVTDHSGCSYNWVEGGFGSWNNTCTSNATRNQTVTCRRSDGTTVSNSNCDAGTKPSTTETSAVYSGCSYSWVEGGFGAWNNTCSSNASRTQTVTCRRSDGTTVGNSNCNAGTKPATTQTQAVYSGCSHDWITGGWQDPGASCTANETQTRSVSCRRSDGTTVSDSNCNSGTRPTTSRKVSDYSGCTYDWQTGSFGSWNNTCTSSATRSRNVTCRRGDGTTVSDSNCNPGTKPATSETSAVYSGCSYNWVESGFGNWNSTCSSSATRTQTVSCRRSDGTTVGNSNCNAGTKPATSQTQAVYSGCGYNWVTGGWQDPGASCTPSETQTRSVTCRRSDGVTVANGNCGGGKPGSTRTVEDYSGCTPTDNLTVNWGGWSGWSSSCSTSATRTRSGTCLANGTPVASSVCTSRGLAVTGSETSAQYSGCSYTPTYAPNWSACTNGSQSRAMTSCRRDQTGQSVSTSTCVNAGHAAQLVRACDETPHCWYHDRFAYASHVPGSNTVYIRYSIGSGVTGTPTGFAPGNYSGSISIPAGSNPSGRTTTINGVKFKVGTFARAAGTGGGRGGSGDPNSDAYGICRSTP